MTFPTGIGSILAVIVLVITVVLAVVGRMDTIMALLIGLLAVARLT